jgi:molybdopterin-guanine dinucleotide biosynthesis protein A
VAIAASAECAAAILAGGRATRLGGIAKGLIEFDGRTILDAQLDVLRPLFDEVFVVANDPEPYRRFGLPIVGDRILGCGPLGGLHAALCACRAPHLFLCACDMPALSGEAVRLVAGAGPEFEVVVPVVGGRPEPLHARYARAALPAIERALEMCRFKMSDCFADLRVLEIPEDALRRIDPDLSFLENLNVPEDLPR